MNRRRLVAAARGDVPGDLLLANARIVNVFTSEIEQGDVLVAEGHVAGIGAGYQASDVVDLRGAFLLPGFISGHTHPESSYLWLPQYASLVVSHGTTTVITDLHELVNVSGLAAVGRLLQDVERLPLEIFLMVPSCVPASDLETSGARVLSSDVADALQWPSVLGLGELMDYGGLIEGDSECLDKAIVALQAGKVIDGHAPGLTGHDLNAYLAAGAGSDHECTTLPEGRLKLQRGMRLMIREGTSEENLEDLLPLVTDATYPRCLLVVDDRSCRDLLRHGELDAVVRKAIRLGLNPIRAIQLATINPATYFGLRDRGAIAPGFVANMIVADDLADLRPREVYHNGQLVASDGRCLADPGSLGGEDFLHTVRLNSLSERDFAIPGNGRRMRVIQVVPRQISTRQVLETVRSKDGYVVADTQRDIIRAAVIERHTGSGNIGVGLVQGFGLQRGALASTVAHDSHNLMIVGCDEPDMYTAAQEIQRCGGGLAVVADGRLLASLPLPIAGLMSPDSPEDVVSQFDIVEAAARDLGVTLPNPFAVLSFLALSVLPELRLTDKGLVDVRTKSLVPLAVD